MMGAQSWLEMALVLGPMGWVIWKSMVNDE
jgi:hypothetical protein